MKHSRTPSLVSKVIVEAKVCVADADAASMETDHEQGGVVLAALADAHALCWHFLCHNPLQPKLFPHCSDEWNSGIQLEDAGVIVVVRSVLGASPNFSAWHPPPLALCVLVDPANLWLGQFWQRKTTD